MVTDWSRRTFGWRDGDVDERPQLGNDDEPAVPDASSSNRVVFSLLRIRSESAILGVMRNPRDVRLRRAQLSSIGRPGAQYVKQNALNVATLSSLVGVALLSVGGCAGQSCKTIGSPGPLVRISIAESLSDGATTFRVCADTTCQDGLVPTPVGGGTFVVFFVDSGERWGPSVNLSIAASGTSNLSATTKVQRHAFYPGCLDTPVVSARFDASTGKLDPTRYTFNDPPG